jgi:DNA-binding transcriptional LysR family regulator
LIKPSRTASHPLAELAEIPFRKLWDEPFIATPPESGWWRDYWLAIDEREGHPVTIGVIARNPDEWLTAIANGYGVSLNPEATARFYQRPGACEVRKLGECRADLQVDGLSTVR